MAITRPLEFDQTPNRILLEIGEQARQDALLQRRLQQENMNKQYQILQEINPATLYPKFEKEVVDQTMGGLTERVAGMIKDNPNMSYTDLQNNINKELGQVAAWSARVKTAKDNIAKGIETIKDDDPFDKGRLRALALDQALYKTDEFGRKVLKSPEEIDIGIDYVESAKADERVVDPSKGVKSFLKIVNDAPLLELDDTKTIETPDGIKTTKTGTRSNLPFYLQNKDGKISIRQDDRGYIDERVYQTFYSDPRVQAWVNSGAKDVMKAAGVPDSPEASEWFKRSYLTNFLESQLKGSLKNINDVTYAKQGSSSSEKPKTDVAIYDVFSSIESKYNKLPDVAARSKGKIETYYGKPLNSFDAKEQETIVKMVNAVAKRRDDEGNEFDYKQADLVVRKDKDGNYGIYSFPDNQLKITIDSGKGTGLVANKDQGQKAKQKILKEEKPQTYSINNKQYTKSDLIGMGYTEEQIQQAIKLGNIKLK